MVSVMTDDTQFATYCVPTVDEARAAGLDPEAWEPVLDLADRGHRLQLALAAEMPIVVPEWREMGWFPFQGAWRHDAHNIGRRDGYDAEADRRHNGDWEIWLDTDDPQFETVTFPSEPEARWFVAVLAALEAGLS